MERDSRNHFKRFHAGHSPRGRSVVIACRVLAGAYRLVEMVVRIALADSEFYVGRL